MCTRVAYGFGEGVAAAALAIVPIPLLWIVFAALAVALAFSAPQGQLWPVCLVTAAVASLPGAAHGRAVRRAPDPAGAMMAVSAGWLAVAGTGVAIIWRGAIAVPVALAVVAAGFAAWRAHACGGDPRARASRLASSAGRGALRGLAGLAAVFAAVYVIASSAQGSVHSLH